ncbi:5'-methylthioadenosine/S-adenosylhomocysteine nucleosidase family protein [Tahibacter harae]|uniref:Response regulatory domain-containing protein n=1 Tax=Tahibacter harae TaxID=2963937 RepID=A0ABT1QV46_9GAMM|nr:hypothetical protein [Tahibacter harae]MCQ4166163.1 hypothetical protein [Tahibacter harae]
MKILLADDNVLRIRKIVEHLTTKLGLPRESIVDKRTASDAREYLRAEQVDLLLLDILLPNRVESVESADASITLLTEIVEKKSLKKPTKVVGITAYADVAASQSKYFGAETWVVVETSEVEDGWLDRISNCVAYLLSCVSQTEARSYQTDVVVLTALKDPEMIAIRNLPWRWGAEEPIDDSTFISRGTFESGGASHSVVCAVAERMGMLSTALLAAKLIEKLRPRLLVMPGICAGIGKNIREGDVIFADCAWDYQSGKFTTVASTSLEGFEIDPHMIQAPREVSTRIDQLQADEEMLTRIWRRWPERPSQPPKLVRAPVASGSAVVADERVVTNVLRQHRKAKGLEMELYGLYLAGQTCDSPRPYTFGIKAICDFADGKKADGYQKYAAYVSAEVLAEFLKRYYADLPRR